jgi:hypothetical protein
MPARLIYINLRIARPRLNQIVAATATYLPELGPIHSYSALWMGHLSARIVNNAI